VQRDDLPDGLTMTLRRVLEAELPTHFERARKRAGTSLRKHGEDAAADALPQTCPTPSTRSPATGCPRAAKNSLDSSGIAGLDSAVMPDST
jgi:hypothetical protein